MRNRTPCWSCSSCRWQPSCVSGCVSLYQTFLYVNCPLILSVLSFSSSVLHQIVLCVAVWERHPWVWSVSTAFGFIILAASKHLINWVSCLFNDRYFNYRTTRFLTEEGFYKFHNWFDDRAWYPLGRIIGGTIYPGTAEEHSFKKKF